MRLALQTGCTTIHELLTGERVPMTPADMGLWEEFYGLEPWGPSQAAYGFGTIASILVNKDRKRGSPAVKASDFFPALKKSAGKPDKKKQEEALKAGLNSMKRRRRKK